MSVPLTQISVPTYFDESPLERPKNLLAGLIAVISPLLVDLLAVRSSLTPQKT